MTVHVVEHAGRTFYLGRHLDAASRHDPRSRNFPGGISPLRTVLHPHGPILDQGQLGSCTGNATVGALNSQPIRGTRKLLAEKDAVAIYSAATRLDSFPGTYLPTDTGSDGLSVAKAARAKGLISSYQHAFGVGAALGALVNTAIIVGTKWTQDMFTADSNGFVHPTGAVAGGHEWAVIGLDVEHQFITAQNSWGAGWGPLGGLFRLSFADFGSLLADGGDATILIR